MYFTCLYMSSYCLNLPLLNKYVVFVYNNNKIQFNISSYITYMRFQRALEIITIALAPATVINAHTNTHTLTQTYKHTFKQKHTHTHTQIQTYLTNR